MFCSLLGKIGRELGFILAAFLIATAGYGAWFITRAQPEPISLPLFEGIRYVRAVEQAPRPIISHIVRIALDTPGLSFLVTPVDKTSSRQLSAQTTSEFLRRHRLQLAINGDFFYPQHSHGPWDYYPHVGDPVDVRGYAVAQGRRYGATRVGRLVLSVTCAGQVTFGPPSSRVCEAISGSAIVRHGRSLAREKSTETHPRSAIALDRAGRTLLLIAIDGRQPFYSEGVTMSELARFILTSGGHDAINLDGGGSTALILGDQQGKVYLLNSPIHARTPGWERPVANHFGLRVAPR
jgi:hypothetical protein